ncbi:hypothetical protein AVEN_170845-1 [Araneus ventricosus]|uniref:HAT C-terminal dimerisation domain-containing protein n=1 Tax=Araneus ventricosus TaxID=182803 RepID=A0A4Y2RMC9_ARAVE|nr:hypothetical protein AVEN_97238-1 [Araneus ventricosus]GBN76858.1 hypothetical protein AVEN_102514-1 [Araneus ventricosus]GBN76903.1 hypothetical protein AVEN_132461-1 [Araneus ventricosus]GBN76911.1 hypothetical protein AVEN_170845-1 [Araneus ventricosus]
MRPVYAGLSPYFTTQSSITICTAFAPMSGMARNRNTIAYLQVRNIDIGNIEILFNQFVYLKDIEKNNINRNSEATIKLSMEDKWLKPFEDTKCIDQKSCTIKLCKYAFAIQAHNVNVERMFSLMSTQWSDEINTVVSGAN